jgi:hypothetical protein
MPVGESLLIEHHNVETALGMGRKQHVQGLLLAPEVPDHVVARAHLLPEVTNADRVLEVHEPAIGVHRFKSPIRAVIHGLNVSTGSGGL